MRLFDRWGNAFEGTAEELRKWNDKEAKRLKRASKRRVEMFLSGGPAEALDRVLARSDMQIQELFQLFLLQLDALDDGTEFKQATLFPRIRPLDLEKFYQHLGHPVPSEFPEEAEEEAERDDD